MARAPMEHSYPSKRPELERTIEGLEIAADVAAIAALGAKDRASVLARREPEVADATARRALARRAGRLGLLLEDLDATLPTPALASHYAAWAALVQRGAAWPDASARAIDEAAGALRALHDAIAPIEHDDGSSSLSDYSDSETQSTEEEEESDDADS